MRPVTRKATRRRVPPPRAPVDIVKPTTRKDIPLQDQEQARLRLAFARALTAKLGFARDKHYKETVREVAVALLKDHSCCLLGLWLRTTSFNKFCNLFAVRDPVQWEARQFRRKAKNAVSAGKRSKTKPHAIVCQGLRRNALIRLFRRGQEPVFVRWFNGRIGPGL